jgi:subtilisin family serine protease
LSIHSNPRTYPAALLIVAFLATCPAGFAAGPVRRNDSVGAEVYEALGSQPKVRVLVFLRPPAQAKVAAAGTGGAVPDQRSRIDAVAARQDAVLASLAPGDFRLMRRFMLVPAFAGEITSAGITALAARPDVDRIDLDAGGHLDLAEVVPLIRADTVGSIGLTGQGVTVAMLDTGIDTHHPDLQDALVAQACFCSGGTGCCPNGATSQFGGGAAEDDNGHGSGVAGVITSNGVVSPHGVAPGARLVVVKVVDSAGAFCCSSDVVAGLDWIDANRPDVTIVNMSLGTMVRFTGDCDDSRSFTRALAASINSLRSRGVITFASTGNEGSADTMEAPACVSNVVSVGAVYDSNVGPVTSHGCTDATTAADQVTCFTNSDSSTDLFAPGAPTTSDGLAGGINTYYGTSFASPAAAACAADLLQADPSLTPAAIETALKATDVRVVAPGNGLSFPRLDCLAALQSLATATGVVVSGDPLSLSWDTSPYATAGYDIYRGRLGEIRSAGALVTQVLACGQAGSTFDIAADASAVDDGFVYFVAPHGSFSDNIGYDSQGSERPLTDSCP